MNSATWTECYEESSASSRSGEKIRLEIQFHLPHKIVNPLIQSDIHLQVTANKEIRRAHVPRNKTSQRQKRFSSLQRTQQQLRSAACRFRTAQTTRTEKGYIQANKNVRWNLSSHRIPHIRHVEKEE